MAAQLQSYSLDPPEHDGGARFPKNSSEIGNPAKPTKTELSGEFSGESRRFPATNHRSKCSSRQELSNGTKHASNERRMKKLWTIEVLKKFEKNKIRRERERELEFEGTRERVSNGREKEERKRKEKRKEKRKRKRK